MKLRLCVAACAMALWVSAPAPAQNPETGEEEDELSLFDLVEQGLISEEEFIVEMVSSLNPELDGSEVDLLGLLENPSPLLLEAEAFREAFGDVSTDRSTDALGGGYVSTGGDASLAYDLDVALAGTYFARARIRGDTALTLQVGDGEPLVFEQPPDADGFVWVDLGSLELSPGSLDMLVSLNGGAALDALEIIPPCSPVTAAADLNPDAPLTYGKKAQLMAQALNLQSQLPKDPSRSFKIEGERWSSVDGTEPDVVRDRAGGATGRGLAVASEPVNITYSFRIPRDGMYSLTARVKGAAPQYAQIDGCVQGAGNDEPPDSGGEQLYDIPLLTTRLEAGQHQIQFPLPAGTGLDHVLVEGHRDADEDYLGVMFDEGFVEGASKAADNEVAFGEAEQEIRGSLGDFRVVDSALFGPASGDKVVVTESATTLSYDLDITENNSYDVDLRLRGEGEVKVKVSGTDQELTVDLEAGSFQWLGAGELELPPGKHTLTIELPPDTVFDSYLVSTPEGRRGWLRSIADQAVTREEAEDNLSPPLHETPIPTPEVTERQPDLPPLSPTMPPN